MVYDIFMWLSKKKSKKDQDIISWDDIKQALGVIYNEDLSCMPSSYIRVAFDGVRRERRQLMQRKKVQAFEEYIMKLWKLPNINSGTKRRKRLEENETEVPAKPKVSKLEIFSSMVEKEALEKLAKENNTFAARIEALEEENKKLKAEIHRLKEENTTMRNRIKS